MIIGCVRIWVSMYLGEYLVAVSHEMSKGDLLSVFLTASPLNFHNPNLFSRSILSFGAPQPNKYKIIVEGRDPIVFETEAVSRYSLIFQIKTLHCEISTAPLSFSNGVPFHPHSLV